MLSQGILCRGKRRLCAVSGASPNEHVMKWRGRGSRRGKGPGVGQEEVSLARGSQSVQERDGLGILVSIYSGSQRDFLTLYRGSQFSHLQIG